MENVLSISLRLNFTPNALGCCRLKRFFLNIVFHILHGYWRFEFWKRTECFSVDQARFPVIRSYIVSYFFFFSVSLYHAVLPPNFSSTFLLPPAPHYSSFFFFSFSFSFFFLFLLYSFLCCPFIFSLSLVLLSFFRLVLFYFVLLLYCSFLSCSSSYFLPFFILFFFYLRLFNV